MKKILLAPLALLGLAAGPAMVTATPAHADPGACLPELSPESPPPNPEDDCDSVGDPDEGGSHTGGGSVTNPPPPPPPPPRP